MMPDKYKDIKDINQIVMETDIQDIYKFVVDNSYNYFSFWTRSRLNF